MQTANLLAAWDLSRNSFGKGSLTGMPYRDTEYTVTSSKQKLMDVLPDAAEITCTVDALAFEIEGGGGSCDLLP